MGTQTVDTNIEVNMKELATHMVSSAPLEVVKTFSIDFLIQSFKDDIDTFETTWIEYQKQLQEGQKDWDALQDSNIIKFPQKGDSNVN